jgi:hypothetical protein
VRRNEQHRGHDNTKGREGTDKTKERRGNGKVGVNDKTEGDNIKGKDR